MTQDVIATDSPAFAPRLAPSFRAQRSKSYQKGLLKRLYGVDDQTAETIVIGEAHDTDIIKVTDDAMNQLRSRGDHS